MNRSALVDTPVMLGFLRGQGDCAAALAPYPHLAISLVSWLEVMAQCPPALLDRTRLFLRRCERLSISEAIADEALNLLRADPALNHEHALVLATARSNRLPLVSLGADGRPFVQMPG
jgi:hypothetical protein